MLRKLVHRELSTNGFNKSDLPLSSIYHNVSLKNELPFYKHPELSNFLHKSGRDGTIPKVVEMIHTDCVFVLLFESGICISIFHPKPESQAFNGRMVLNILNRSPQEHITTIFHNKPQRELIVVLNDRKLKNWNISTVSFSDLEGNNKIQLNSRSKSLKMIEPAYVQFDDLNNRLLVHHHGEKSHVCDVYDLISWKKIFSFVAANNVRIGEGVIAIYEEECVFGPYIIVRCLSTSDGRQLFHTVLPGCQSRHIDFIIPFHDRLMVKKYGCNLEIYCLKTRQMNLVSHYIPPSAHFIFPLNHNYFITKYNGVNYVWNKYGALEHYYKDGHSEERRFFDSVSIKTCLTFWTDEKSVYMTDLSTGNVITTFSLQKISDVCIVGHNNDINQFVTVNTQGIQIWC